MRYNEKPIGTWDMGEVQNKDPGTSNAESIFWEEKVCPTVTSSFGK